MEKKKTSRAQFFYERSKEMKITLRHLHLCVHSHVQFGAEQKNREKEFRCFCGVCAVDQMTGNEWLHIVRCVRATKRHIHTKHPLVGLLLSVSFAERALFDAGKSRQSPGPRIRCVPPIIFRFPNISNISNRGTDYSTSSWEAATNKGKSPI